MRVDLPGVERRGDPFEIRFEGRVVDAWPGESLAAALLSAGEAGLRTSETGEPRGLWCGMGVCGECRVVVDGRDARACMTVALPGQSVLRAPARAGVRASQSWRGAADLAPDVLVVGAGPAGLSAARVAAEAGCDVLVADERAKAGGQYFKQPGTGFAVDPSMLDGQTREGAALIEATAAAGAAFLQGATMWAAEAAVDGRFEVRLQIAGGAVTVRPRRLVLAMGAYERPWPVLGWTLPGVMTTGAAQTLLRAYATAPGRRVLVAGNGPLNAQVARELVRVGVKVVALAEQAPAPAARQFATAMRMMAAAPGLVAQGAAMLVALRRAGVAVLHRHVVVGLDGDDRVAGVTLAALNESGAIRPGSERRFTVDAVCLGYGFLPQLEAARALGCAVEQRDDGSLAIARDDAGRTNVAGVQVIGDGGGLGGARVAMATGLLAGAALARELGATSVDVASVTRTRRRLARHRRFQTALWSLYAAPPAPLPVADAWLCRCESISVGTVEALVEAGSRDMATVKRATRVGMGACGGRYCATALASRLPATPDVPPGFAPRAPFKPVPVGAIAADGFAAS